ncbi:hypothetical protein Bca4012_102566 [Brassica carinata]
MGRPSAFVSTGRPVSSVGDTHLALTGRVVPPRCYFEEIRVLKASLRLYTLAWDNIIGFRSYCVGLRIGVMINRDSRGIRDFIVRGEILGFMKDEQLRKHLPRMFSLIKNESWGSRRSDTALVSTINDADQDQRMLLLGLAGTL